MLLRRHFEDPAGFLGKEAEQRRRRGRDVVDDDNTWEKKIDGLINRIWNQLPLSKSSLLNLIVAEVASYSSMIFNSISICEYISNILYVVLPIIARIIVTTAMTHPPISPLPGANASSAAVDDPNGNKDSLSAAAQVSLANLPSPGKGDVGKDVEQAIHLKPQELELPAPALEKSTRSAALWMGINILATIGIVFINKALFSDSRLKHAQITFAAFHFVITWLALFILSRPYVGMFTSRRGPIVQLTPLAIAMSLNVILTNLSLAYSTVTFYQVARILLKPTVASMNLFLYRSTLPRNAIYALVPACIGVGIVSYYDSRPSKDAPVKTTSTLGVIFAIMGIFASSLYTVWISTFHKKMKLNSMQLLLNQAPLAAFMLLYVIPLADSWPVWKEAPTDQWMLILLVSVVILYIFVLSHSPIPNRCNLTSPKTSPDSALA